jgi:hypothetical protein
MNPFSSSILLSAMRKSSNALVKGHYVDKYPQKVLKSELSANWNENCLPSMPEDPAPKQLLVSSH